MKILIVFSACFYFAIAARYVSFNSNNYCGISGGDNNTMLLHGDDIIYVRFRPLSSSIGSSVFFRTIDDDCIVKFASPSLSNARLQVRFDSMRRFVNTRYAKLEFYDSDAARVGRLIRSVSRYSPLRSNDTITTTGPFLTIRGSRDVKNAKNYDVEMSIRVVNSASTARWGLCAVVIAAATFL